MSSGPPQGIADIEEDGPRPLQLQPRIFAQQISGHRGVARSPISYVSQRTPRPDCGGRASTRRSRTWKPPGDDKWTNCLL